MKFKYHKFLKWNVYVIAKKKFAPHKLLIALDAIMKTFRGTRGNKKSL